MSDLFSRMFFEEYISLKYKNLGFVSSLEEIVKLKTTLLSIDKKLYSSSDELAYNSKSKPNHEERKLK